VPAAVEINEPEAKNEKQKEEKPIGSSIGQPGCKHHIGYLGEREPNVQIPDECLTCKEIVQCMLKKT
jgi:hypothetical protein